MTIALKPAKVALRDWWSTVIINGAHMQAVFVDEKRPFVSPTTKAIAVMTVMAIAADGHDEIRWTTSGDELIPEVNGLRKITISCRVDSYSQNDDETAFYYAERGRSRLRLPRVQAALAAAGLALVQTTNTTPLPMQEQERAFSRAAFDATFAIVAIEREDLDQGQDTIGSVEMSSNQLLTNDGLPSETQINTVVTEP
jgi:hypothetical protein